MKNNKAFTLMNNDKTSFFNCYLRFLPIYHWYKNNIKDSLKGKTEKDVAPLVLLGEELYELVS
jgi:hypothetical protein